ncbi:uncharacterized protein BDZ99DRAFT_572351 [Mytilinidion resinicola]|uniref:BTB domain-containing protein n=1 Tax=Mytilinidion resinicola TaxID=574789 RepID=A0A6A6YKJ4_9PEZI|nr:uncharacterized protein BDZ99DRAFT_572351 [Mytilinidion resinicola]KAF2808494.1 hypothetical protein BDZ99DRAFT_572351 [Mytilinidion resinicola]
MASEAGDITNGSSKTFPSPKIFQEAVHIEVGPEGAKFIVHPQLLLATAGLFHRTGVAGAKDPISRIFKFGNRDPVQFGIFVRWLYKQHPQVDRFNIILGAYQFAITLDAPAFRNYLLGLMCNKLVEQQYFPSATEFKEVWEKSDDLAAVKKLLLDVCVWGTAQPAAGWSELFKEVPPTFVMDYAVAQASKGSREAPFTNGIKPYEDEVPANRQHPYHDRDAKPDFPDSTFANAIQVKVGPNGEETFFIHAAFFRGLDSQLDALITQSENQQGDVNLPQTTAEVFGPVVESVYFGNNDVFNSFALAPPVEPVAEPMVIDHTDAESTVPVNTSATTESTDSSEPEIDWPTRPHSRYETHRPVLAQPPTAPAASAAPAAPTYSHAAPPYSRGYAGSISDSPEYLPLPLGWHFFVSDFRKRLYVDQITGAYTQWDPRAVGKLPQGWGVRLEMNGNVWFENPASKARSEVHPSTSKDWTAARIQTMGKRKAALFGMPQQ